MLTTEISDTLYDSLMQELYFESPFPKLIGLILNTTLVEPAF